MSNIKKDIIETKGFSIQDYTEEFKNSYVSFADIAKYRNKERMIEHKKFTRI